MSTVAPHPSMLALRRRQRAGAVNRRIGWVLLPVMVAATAVHYLSEDSTPLAAVLCGLAFAAVLMAISAATESEQWLPAIFRFGIVPLFLFSGTFFPVEQLPDWIEPLAWATPLWHGVELTRDLATGEIEAASAAVHVGYLVALTVLGTAIAARACGRKLLR